MDDRAALGRDGERRAERHLRGLRYRLVCRNYRCPAGEIDLIFLDESTVVFVEVKTRTGREHAEPIDAVNPEKQRRIGRTARYFLKVAESTHRLCRFDIVAVVIGDAKRIEVEHFRNAFSPDD